MAFEDSDSSEDDLRLTTTNVVLGFASKDPTDDDFSQLGGHPVSTYTERCWRTLLRSNQHHRPGPTRRAPRLLSLEDARFVAG